MKEENIGKSKKALEIQEYYNKVNLVKKYYETPETIAKIQQSLTFKETIFKNKDGKIIRCIKTNNGIYLKKNLDHYELLKNKYNIYHSIATFSYFPLFSWNINKRKEQYADWTQNKKYLKFIKQYDFYIDFDNKGDYDITFAEVRTVSSFLTKKNIIHTVIFSGSGFHIKSRLKKENQNPTYCRQLAEGLINGFGLETVDLSIYRWQGIIKAPYSIDFKTNRICTPIRPDLLKDFKISDTELK